MNRGRPRGGGCGVKPRITNAPVAAGNRPDGLGQSGNRVPELVGLNRGKLQRSASRAVRLDVVGLKRPKTVAVAVPIAIQITKQGGLNADQRDFAFGSKIGSPTSGQPAALHFMARICSMRCARRFCKSYV